MNVAQNPLHEAKETQRVIFFSSSLPLKQAEALFMVMVSFIRFQLIRAVSFPAEALVLL